MAKKRQKTNLKSDPMKALLRIVHSTQSPVQGIAKARSLAPEMSLELLDRLYEHPVFKGILQRHLFPRDLSVLSYMPPLHQSSATADLAWLSRLCGKYATELSEFVNLRDKFETSFQLGEMDIAESVIELIKEKFGYSFWYINYKFQLVQHGHGLSAQKEFLAELLAQKDINPLVGYFSYIFSLKADPNVSAQFIEELADEFASISPRRAGLFRYVMSPLSLLHQRELSQVVRAADNGPLIDRYQLLVRVLQVLTTQEHGTVPDIVSICLKEISDIQDVSLNTIKLLSGVIYSSAATQETLLLKAYDAYTLGNYEESASRASALICGDGASQPLLELFVRANCHLETPVEIPAKEGSPLRLAISAIDSITRMSPEYESSFPRAEKLALNHDQSLFGLQLAAFTKRKHRFAPGSSYSDLDALWAVSSPAVNPWHFDVFKEISRKAAELIEDSTTDSVSHQLRRALAQDDEHTLAELPIPAERARGYRGFLAMSKGDYDLASELFSQNIGSSELLTELAAKEALFRSLLETEDFEGCIALVMESFHKNAISIFQYDLEELISSIDQHADVKDKIRLCNVISLAIRYFDCQLESKLSDRFEDVIERLPTNRPSQLIQTIEGIPGADLVYFLAHVCTVRTMEDCTVFDDMDEIDAERIKICVWLVENDQENKSTYSQEIRTITRSAKMSSLRKKITSSKMYVDEGGIRQILQVQLDEGYRRYQELLKRPDLNFQAEQIALRIGRLLEARDTLEGDKAAMDFRRFKVPSNERLGLLKEIYETVLDRFLFSPEFGLDSHLSANVRHGTFVGQVRSSLAERQLVTTHDRATGAYETNEYWLNLYAGLGPEAGESIRSLLNRFATRVDTIFNTTNDDLLHVRSDKKPLGLFTFVVTDEVLSEIEKSLQADTQLDEFVATIFDAAWRQASQSMHNVRSYLLGDFEQQVLRYVNMLSHDLEAIASRDKLSELFDAIAKARMEIHTGITEISEWFRPPSRIDDEPYTFDIIVDVAESEIRSCFGGKRIDIEKKIGVQSQVGGRKVLGFIEIIFILLQNAVIHCGSPRPDELVVNVSHADGELEIVVSNALASDVPLAERGRLANEATARYTGKTAIERVRTEGGSGLSKIWRTAEYNLKTIHAAAMSVEKQSFLTRVSMKSDGIFL